MDSMRKELTSAIEAGHDMKALMKDEAFTKFYKNITGELATSLALNYSYKDSITRKRIEEQMIFCSGFVNYIDGLMVAGELAQEQLVELNSEVIEG